MLSDINIEARRGRIKQYLNKSIFGNKYLHRTNKMKIGTDHIFNLMSAYIHTDTPEYNE